MRKCKSRLSGVHVLVELRRTPHPVIVSIRDNIKNDNIKVQIITVLPLLQGGGSS